MTAEDRLRDILRSEASEIVPAGDGLARIRTRLARRRRARLLLLPSAAVAAAAATTFLLASSNAPKTQTLQPGGTPTGSSSATQAPSTADGGGTPLDYPAIWPFTSQAQASAWVDDHGAFPWAQDRLAVGTHFVADHLALAGVSVTQTCTTCDVLALSVQGKAVGEVTVRPVGAGFASGKGTQVFTVTGVGGTDLTVTSPQPGDIVTSPMAVTGRITGVDEHVDLRLLSQYGEELAHGGAQAGSAVPWSATLSWTRSDWSAGSVVGVTRSAKDGAVTRLVAVPVARATGATTASFAGIVDGHVGLFDATTGDRLKQLTFPPSGTSDVAASWSVGELAWVRTHGASVCVDELDRLSNGRASRVLTSTTSHLATPALSPSGALLAYVDRPCHGAAQQVVVLGGGAPGRRLGGVPHDVAVLDVRDDGALLLWEFNPAVTGGNLIIAAPGAQNLDSAVALTPAAGCAIGGGGAFDGSSVVVFETCSGGSRLVRYDDQGHRGAADPVVAGMAAPQAVRVRDGRVLVWLPSPDGPIARYSDGVLKVVVPNASCSATPDQKGCLRDPDW